MGGWLGRWGRSGEQMHRRFINALRAFHVYVHRSRCSPDVALGDAALGGGAGSAVPRLNLARSVSHAG